MKLKFVNAPQTNSNIISIYSRILQITQSRTARASFRTLVDSNRLATFGRVGPGEGITPLKLAPEGIVPPWDWRRARGIHLDRLCQDGFLVSTYLDELSGVGAGAFPNAWVAVNLSKNARAKLTADRTRIADMSRHTVRDFSKVYREVMEQLYEEGVGGRTTGGPFHLSAYSYFSDDLPLPQAFSPCLANASYCVFTNSGFSKANVAEIASCGQEVYFAAAEGHESLHVLQGQLPTDTVIVVLPQWPPI